MSEGLSSMIALCLKMCSAISSVAFKAKMMALTKRFKISRGYGNCLN